MKKLILIPITLTALSPTISLVGCGNPDKPEPPEPESWEVTDQEMQDALALKQHEYVQISLSSMTTVTGNNDGYMEFSPNCYYTKSLNQVGDGNERFVFKEDGPSYKKYVREFETHQPGDWTGPTPSSSDEFVTVEEKGQSFLASFYTAIVSEGSGFMLEKSKKCYFGSIYNSDHQTSLDVELYFKDKQLTKICTWVEIDSQLTAVQKYIFAYDKIDPVPPII